jgi:hypothetical protein
MSAGLIVSNAEMADSCSAWINHKVEKRAEAMLDVV